MIRQNIGTKSVKNRKKSVLPMSTVHKIQRFKSCYTEVSIIATSATDSAINMLQQAALQSMFKMSGIYLFDKVLVQLQAVPLLYK